MIRHFPITAVFVFLVLSSAHVFGAEDSDIEIIDPELLLEEDEETPAQEPETVESPGAGGAGNTSSSDTEADDTEPGPRPAQTGADSEALDVAYTALQNQEYDTAYDLFYALAAQDDALAQYEIGSLYHRGAGVDKDVLRASRWYERSAELGYVEAQYRLGNMYLMGEGVRQSDSEAAHWFEKAAQQGHADARSNMSNLQRISTARTREELEQEAASLPPLEVRDKSGGKKKVKKRGFFKRWFGKDGKSAAQPRKQEEASPVEQEVVAEPGNPEDAGRTDSAAVKIDDVARRPATKNKKKGFFSRLLRRGGDKEEKSAGATTPASGTDTTSPAGGSAAAPPAPISGSSAVSNYELGMAYALGDTLGQDHDKAFEHFTSSAEQGYAPAQYRLGVAYANGDGTGKDLARAIEWYEKSASQGYIIAQRSLASIYLYGQEEITPDRILALAWYNLLVEDGNRMDIHRRATLLQELSDDEIRRAQEITTGIQSQVTAAGN